MNLSEKWRKALNDLMIWSYFESPGKGWICVFHDTDAPAFQRLGLVVEGGRITQARNLGPAPAFPAPGMFRSFEEGRQQIMASGRQMPISDMLAAFSPLSRWREPRDFAEESPFSFAARVVLAFRKSVEVENPTLAARLPLNEMYEEARAHIAKNKGIRALLDLVRMEQLARLSYAPLHSNDSACFEWYGVWRQEAANVDPAALQRRTQAMEAAPFLAGVIPYFPALRKAVDAGQPLFEATEKIGLATKNMAAIASLRLPMIAGEDSQPGAFIEKLGFLRELPPDWLKEARLSPENGKGLAMLLSLSQRAKNLKLPHDLLTAKAGGKWMEHLARIAKAGTDRRPPEGMEEAQFRKLREHLPFDEVAAAVPTARRAVARFHVERLCAAREPGPSLDDIAAWAARIAAPDLRRGSLAHLLEGMRNMAVSFAAGVMAPLVTYEAGVSGRMALTNLASLERMAAEVLFGGKGGSRVAELTRVFLNNEPRILGGVVEDPDAPTASRRATTAETLTDLEIRRFGLEGASEPAWPMIARPVMAPNGLAVVPLWSKGHLENEGRGWNGSDQNEDGSRGLQICVGSHGYYMTKCLAAKTQILSIRRLGQNGEPFTRLSCVELEVKSLTEVQNVQHRGRHNSAPPQEAVNALNWWLSNLGDSIKFNPAWQEFCRKGGISLSPHQDPCRVLCGYDWRKRSNIERAWSAWRGILGKDIPELEAILARQDVKGLIANISPSSADVEDVHDVAFTRPR